MHTLLIAINCNFVFFFPRDSVGKLLLWMLFSLRHHLLVQQQVKLLFLLVVSLITKAVGQVILTGRELTQKHHFYMQSHVLFCKIVFTSKDKHSIIKGS